MNGLTRRRPGAAAAAVQRLLCRRRALLAWLLLAACGLLAGCGTLTLPSTPAGGPTGGAAASSPQRGGNALYMKAKGGYPSLAPLLKRVTPAVVNVAVISDVSLEDQAFLTDPAFRQFLEQLDIEPPDPEELRQRQSVGSGVIVDGRRGLVLTNAHVIEDARDITVTLKDRRSFKAQLIGRDVGTDIAVLQMMPVDTPRVPFANSNDLEVGDFVLAIGNPFGLGQTVTSGIVSAVGRTGIADDSLGELIQTDASINPGNSGGPLIDLAGRIVGINTALIGPSGGNVGIGFAVPGNRVLRAMRRIVGGR
ncbi:MAG: trypsin-like peptidase domain-containing protein [Thiohalocapsa sp.]|uniref:trypsin-like peptidase domain-containing protein n=1 Tax=Thiohalocapsa sp. TaxID=2497641 RepID=UPI0025F3661D|nr:trypsin-like peptidase domain-containing protein [Thiohalocapsa sp.]MCG6941090.1 trypsin-like peptidase domain-containing protein [Thiohalocapsa sp.]